MCLGIGKWLFKKIVSYKASKNLRENLSKNSLLVYLASVVGLVWLALASPFLLLWPGLAHSWGTSRPLLLPQEG